MKLTSSMKRFTSSVTNRYEAHRAGSQPQAPRSASLTTSPSYGFGALGRSKQGSPRTLSRSSGHLGDEEKNKIPVDVLEVTVHEGTSLLSMDAGGKSDPYCILKMNRSGHTFKTKTKFKTLTPKWEETFSLKTKNIREGKINDFLQVAVYDYDVVGQNDFMGHVDVPCGDLSVDTPVTNWYEVVHPDDPSKPAGSVRLTLSRCVRYESESGVTRGLRKKMFATMMFTKMKLVEWEIEAELSVEILFGVFKMTMSVAVEKGEQTLEEMQFEVNDAMREASNDPIDGEEEEQPPAFVDGESMSSYGSDSGGSRSMGESGKSGTAPSTFDRANSSSTFKKKSTFDRTLEKSLSKLKSALAVSRAQFEERQLTGSIGVGVVLGIARMEIEVMVTMRISRQQTELRNPKSRPTSAAPSPRSSPPPSLSESSVYPKLQSSPSNSSYSS